MSLTEWVMSAGMAIFISIVLGVYMDSKKREDKTSDKINRVYTRLDEVKKNNDDVFTRKDVCSVLHAQLGKDIADMRADVKFIIQQLQDRT